MHGTVVHNIIISYSAPNFNVLSLPFHINCIFVCSKYAHSEMANKRIKIFSNDYTPVPTGGRGGKEQEGREINAAIFT